MLYPWQSEQWQQISRAKQENRLPHALLLVGMAGIGKANFADCLVRAHLCLYTRDAAVLPVQGADHKCDCHPCRLMSGRAHPNILWVEPEKAGGAIKVDQVREISDFINQTSLQGDMRFVVMNPANAMNASAANALLKTLEEPSSGALLILISDQTSQLPATILSRCQRISFSRPANDVALAWLRPQLSEQAIDVEQLLRLANGAPLAALQWVNTEMLTVRQTLFQTLSALKKNQANPLKSAAALQEMELLQFLDFILTWTMDLMRLQLGGGLNTLVNQDCADVLTGLQRIISIKQCNRYLEYLQQLRSQISVGMNLNKQLVMESVFIRWMECA